jgi:hypothetical protein
MELEQVAVAASQVVRGIVVACVVVVVMAHFQLH